MVTAQEMGKAGGKAKSEAKTVAARKNASKSRGRWVTAMHYGVIGADDKLRIGHLLLLKRFDFDLLKNEGGIIAVIDADLAWEATAALPFKNIEYFGGTSLKLP